MSISERLTMMLLGGLVLLSTTGCSGGKATVRGKITYQGKTLAMGTVYVEGADGVQRPGTIMPDGSYQVDQLPAGPARIAVVSPKPAAVDSAAVLGKKSVPRPPDAPPLADAAQWFPIPEQYGDPKSSGLAIKLTSGENIHDIKLD
jgi:hypothetical protein